MIRIMLLLVALGAGGAAGWATLNMRSEPTRVIQKETPAPTQDVLVAAADVAPGQPLAKERLRWQAWPESALNPIHITRSARPDAIETLAGAVVRHRIVAGEPIGEDKLAPKNAGFLAAMLPAGKRAIAVRISAESTAGGFILPNDRVDVLHTVDGADQAPRATRTILRNVTVLAIDQTVDESGKDEKGRSKSTVIGKTATLELDAAQAESLAGAQAHGSISLALRSAADRDEAPSAQQRPSGSTIRIVRGGRTEFVKTQ